MENRQQILLSKQLVTVYSNLPIDVDWDDFKVQPPDRAALMPSAEGTGIHGLIKEYLPPEIGPVVEVIRAETCRLSVLTLFLMFATTAFRSGRAKGPFRACSAGRTRVRRSFDPSIRQSHLRPERSDAQASYVAASR